MKLYKTTLVILTDYDPSDFDLEHLARDANVGGGYCSFRETEIDEVIDDDILDLFDPFAAPGY